MKKKILSFVSVLFGTALLILAFGWFPGFKSAMHASLISFAAAALLPFLLVVAGLGIAVLAIGLAPFFLLLSEGAADPTDFVHAGTDMAQSGVEIGPGYYRFLARQRHPPFWGIPCGVLLGGILLWGLIAWIIIPGEMKTTELLARSKTRPEQIQKQTGRYPSLI